MQRRVQLAARCVGVTALLTAGVFTTVPTTASAEGDKGEHCIVEVTDVVDGTFVLGPEKCFATFADVLRSRGDQNVSDSVTPANVPRSTLVLDAIIGVHYDGANFTGASFSVSGTTCGGGGLNVSAAWNDRISSTTNGCPTITHYENTNYAGATASTFGGGGNITGYMDNRTSSIKYF